MSIDLSGVTSTKEVPPAVNNFFMRMILSTAYTNQIYLKFAQQTILPYKSGTVAVFRRYNELEPANVPLREGVNPTAVPLSVDTIQAKVDWYGNVIKITERVRLTVEDYVLGQAARLIAQNIGRTVDVVVRDVLRSALSVYQCAGGNNSKTPTEFSAADFKVVISTLINNRARMISEVIKGSLQFGTAPVRKAYFMMMHSELIPEIEAVSSFVSVNKYPRSKEEENYLEDEWGSVDNIRIVYSQDAAVNEGDPRVYVSSVVGKEAYGVVNLGSASARMIYHPPGSSGVYDALDLISSMGFLHPFVARVLNDNFMLNVLSTKA